MPSILEKELNEMLKLPCNGGKKLPNKIMIVHNTI